MSLSPATLSSIQQAGQALHDATLAVGDSVRDGAKRMVATIANQPFHSDSDRAFARFRALAKLAHDLQSLEEQLRTLYNTASELVSQDLDVLVALPDPTGRGRKKVQMVGKTSSAAANQIQEAEDAVVKVATTRKVKSNGKRKVSKPDKVQHLTANDNTLLRYLQKSLRADHWTKLTGSTIARGAGMALGSVGVSLNRLVAHGLVSKGDQGRYRLLP